MTLLQKAADFYAALVSEKNPVEPAVLGFRTYLVQHFQIDGMHEADRIDAAFREGKPFNSVGKTAESQENAETAQPKFRTFQHPAQGLGKSRPGELGKIRGRFNTSTIQQEELQEILEPVSQPQSTKKQLDTLPGAKSTKAPTVPAVKEKPAVADSEPAITNAQLEELADMQPSVAVKRFSKGQILEALEGGSVKHNPAGSHRQLAATLINWAKKRS